MNNTTLPAEMKLVGFARAISLFDGIRMHDEQGRTPAPTIDAEALVRFVESKYADHIAEGLLKRGFSFTATASSEDLPEMPEDIAPLEDFGFAEDEDREPTEEELAAI